ncbi:MAG: aminopeptidase P family protein [Planctomycetes bacterium]|nr:aminopeptidase P family protein [Planctomycetota bacterium]
MPVINLDARTAVVMAGVPARNDTLFHRIRFLVGDPTVWVDLPKAGGGRERLLILRDIEMERARTHARADRVACPKDFAPTAGLSGDRETATAQAAAEALRRAGVARAIADRTLPFIYAHEIQKAGIAVECDPALGVIDRRAKDPQELAALREAQSVTEGAIRLACETIARASARADGVLVPGGAVKGSTGQGGEVLTSERVRALVDVWLLERGYLNAEAIIAGGPQGADCHDRGSGELRTGQPVIVDIFPRNRATRYWGDCTRTVVHGKVPAEIARMHAAVLEAKAAAIAAVRAGVTGESVHAAAAAVLVKHGYAMGLPKPDAPDSYCGMVHGTGHGVGLDVHEPPLLDKGGPLLVAGDVLTVEPGLYCKALGGIRVEDMVAVTESGCENFNRLPQGLTWA